MSDDLDEIISQNFVMDTDATPWDTMLESSQFFTHYQQYIQEESKAVQLEIEKLTNPHYIDMDAHFAELIEEGHILNTL